MAKLEKSWITDGHIDFEYKKYVLLAYLQHVKGDFDQSKLYPSLSDLVAHYRDAVLIKEKKKTVKSGFPKEISRLDLSKLEIIYKDLAENDELVRHLEEVVDYAIPTMKDTLEIGKALHEEIEEGLSIDPVGIIPLYKDEGYVLIETGNSRTVDIFQYQVKKFIMHNEQFRGIYFKWIDKVRRGIVESFEQIKLKLIKTYQVLPNPATFTIHSRYDYPMNETLIPISKKLVMQTVKQLQ